MLIKKLAIKKGIRFVRLDSSEHGPACRNCKDDLTQEHCNICLEIFYVTGVGSLSISYVYYIPHDEIL